MLGFESPLSLINFLEFYNDVGAQMHVGCPTCDPSWTEMSVKILRFLLQLNTLT